MYYFKSKLASLLLMIIHPVWNLKKHTLFLLWLFWDLMHKADDSTDQAFCLFVLRIWMHFERACSCNMYCVLKMCGKTHWLYVVLFAALKSPAAFHEQIRSLERARVSAGHYSLVLKSLTQKSANAKRHLDLFAWCVSYVPLRCLKWPELLFVIYTILFFVSVEQWNTWRCFHNFNLYLIALQTENFLKHKIRSRPERAELVRMHILQGRPSFTPHAYCDSWI